MPSLASRVVPFVPRLRKSKKMYGSPDATRDHIDALQVRPGSWAPPLRLDRTVSITIRSFGGWPVYEIAPLSGPERGRALYVHGGAWIHEIIALQWKFVAELVAATGVRVTVPIYPLAPVGSAGPVVATMTELAAELIADAGPERSTLIGDSAGGTIVLATALQLRDRGLPAAHRTILISPALDLSFTNPRLAEIAPTDPWLDIPGTQVAADLWRADLPVDDPRVSPLHGDLTGLAPVTLFSGTRDITNADAHAFVGLAREAGLPVEFHEEPGLLHDYPFMPIPEGRRARALIRAAVLS